MHKNKRKQPSTATQEQGTCHLLLFKPTKKQNNEKDFYFDRGPCRALCS